MKTVKPSQNVDAYIAQFQLPTKVVLAKLRQTIKQAAPQATERMSYGMPFYEFGGSGYKGRLIYFSASSAHISVYIPPSRLKKPSPKLLAYQVSKSAYHFPLTKPFPYKLIERTIKVMVGN